LETKQDVLGTADANGRKAGAKLPASLSASVRDGKGNRVHYDNSVWNRDFEVELLNGQFLVTVVDSMQVNMEERDEKENGKTFKRRRQQVQQVTCRGMGSGSMMLYSADGKPQWKTPTVIRDWFRLANAPSKSPVALFIVGLYDRDIRQGFQSTGLMGIDKKTGETRYKSLIPAKSNPNYGTMPLWNFRIEVEPEADTISYVAPQRKVNAVFTDNPIPPKPEKVQSEPKTEEDKPAKEKNEGEKKGNWLKLDMKIPFLR
jgi:hypothetical protein